MNFPNTFNWPTQACILLLCFSWLYCFFSWCAQYTIAENREVRYEMAVPESLSLCEDVSPVKYFEDASTALKDVYFC